MCSKSQTEKKDARPKESKFPIQNNSNKIENIEVCRCRLDFWTMCRILISNLQCSPPWSWIHSPFRSWDYMQVPPQLCNVLLGLKNNLISSVSMLERKWPRLPLGQPCSTLWLIVLSENWDRILSGVFLSSGRRKLSSQTHTQAEDSHKSLAHWASENMFWDLSEFVIVT